MKHLKSLFILFSVFSLIVFGGCGGTTTDNIVDEDDLIDHITVSEGGDEASEEELIDETEDAQEEEEAEEDEDYVAGEDDQDADEDSDSDQDGVDNEEEEFADVDNADEDENQDEDQEEDGDGFDEDEDYEEPVFTLLADTFINSSSPATNYGDLTYTKAGTGAWGSSTKAVFIKFDISQLPLDINIDSATVKMRVGGDGYCGNVEHVSSYHIYDDSWGEDLITFNNNPCGVNFNNASECSQIFTDTKSVGGGWVTWDITDMVADEYADGNGILSIMLKGEGPGQCDKPFISRENDLTNRHPQITINYTDI